LFLGKENWIGYNYPLDLELEEDGEKLLVIEEHPSKFNLRSLKLSGRMLGDGEVKVYLETNGENYLIFDDESAEEDELSSVTGYIVSVEGEEIEPEEESQEEEEIKKPKKEQKNKKDKSKEDKGKTKGPEEESQEEEVEEEEETEEGEEEESEAETGEEVEEEPQETTADGTESEDEEEIEVPEEASDTNVSEPVEEEAAQVSEKNITVEIPEDVENETAETKGAINGTINDTILTKARINRTNITTDDTVDGGSSSTAGTIANETANKSVEEAIENVTDVIEEIEEAPQIYHVNISYKKFKPEVLQIKAGDTVVWRNTRGVRSPKTAMIVGARPAYKDIRSEELESGDTFSLTFTKPGTYHIVDGVITTMKSKIVVTGEPIGEETAKEIKFNNLCSETCLLPSGLNATEFKLVFEVEEGTKLELDNIWYALEDLTEKITEIAYEKIKDNPEFDVTIYSVVKEGDDLVVVFYHDAGEELPTFVDGKVNYTLSREKAISEEKISLIIHSWDDDYFRIKVGDEIIAFGAQKEFEFNPEIKNARNELVDYDIEFEDADTEIVEKTEEIRKPKGQGLGISSATTLKVKEGRYNIKIKPKKHPIKSIVIDDVEISDDVTEFIDIDDVEETGEFSEYVEVYAIDPTKFNFTKAVVTVTAKGTVLYKCKDWNFSEQRCYGSWTKLMDLTPGEDYTFTLTPEDPGLAEGSGLWFEGFESGSLETNNWTSSGGTTNWYVNGVTARNYGGAYHVEANDVDGETVLETDVDTTGYENIGFSFYAKTTALGTGEYIAADWYNGTSWINVLPETQVIDSYTQYNHSLTLGADNPDFKIRFRCVNDAANKYCLVDNIQVEGTSISCTEDWVQINGSCLINDSRLINYNDTNSCGTTNDLPADNGTYESCNYCSYSVTNTSWTEWQNQGNCLTNDTQQQNRSKTEYDENYGSCYAVTGLASDLWNSGNNNSYWDYQAVGCDYIVSTKFDGSTTNFSTVNLWNIPNLILERTGYGKINFTENVSIDRSLDLDAYVDISDNLIGLDSGNLPELNKSAILTLYNLSFVNPVILGDGGSCPSSKCTKLSYSGGNLVFNVTGFTGYSASEGPYCGDGICNGGESCSSCAADCGSCSSGGSNSGGGGGGRSTREEIVGQTLNETCREDWACKDWSGCIKGKQTRECFDQNNCNTTVFRPSEVRNCGVSCEEKWACTEWGPCLERTQIRVCKDVNDCRTGINKPVETRSGGEVSCSDEIQKQGEEGVDCGGPCRPCLMKEKVTGKAIEVYPETKPNPIFALPAIILLMTLVAIASLRKTKLSKTTKNILLMAHIVLIVLILFLLSLSFYSTITGLFGLEILPEDIGDDVENTISLVSLLFGGVILILVIVFYNKFYKKGKKGKKNEKRNTKKSV